MATLAQKHGVTVESVEFKNGHKEVVGPPKNELTPEEIKELSIHKAIAAAIHKVSLCFLSVQRTCMLVGVLSFSPLVCHLFSLSLSRSLYSTC